MLRCENVTYTYPHQQSPAVRDLSLSVKPGELVLCTGASGCGKSTLIRLLNGLCPHYFSGTLHGRVLVNGTPTTEQTPPQLARQAGTLFQDPEQQFFALNVEDELSFALEWQGLGIETMRHAVAGAVRQFGLEEICRSSIHQLSEGQKQKVGLASLWTQRPQALVLDEPTANLDPESTVELALKLAQLKERGMAILVVDHRLYWLTDVVDRVVVMREGRIEAEGDFTMLHDAELRRRFGLREASVPDARRTLPGCTSAHGLIQARDLTHAHKGRKPLYEGVNFDLPGGVTAIIGHNGAGKTTLARILAGLDQQQNGEILIRDQPCDAKQRMRHSGLVLQNADHQLHMRTVEQEVQTCLELAGQKNHDHARMLLEEFGLLQLAGRHPQSLSGGEKQRLVVACALAKRPSLLILDEPTSGLDGANMHRLAAAIERQAHQERSVLLITHDLELLAGMGRQALRLPLVGPRHIETPLTETPARRQHGNTPSITAQHKNPTAQAV
ncbi:ABC transporter ATP-binding protein [Desulfovibrio sp. UIB00]|uniref:ABC transporter ATP-binding protein n=1 Tax=Desulfovibrio sp. UIB00 TaxID=2804314 RepID=UPI001F0F6D3E|nr:ABC transporter ATP-binding protein [Desulfovibrio sp. UIB00]MCH5146273.1 ABC transporter ATP-binding protein [Desulfovibrio sp. UIB00]